MPLEGDRDLICRVVENLLDNALKYGARTDIHLAARMADDRIIISVSDGGPGIPEHLRERVFSRYEHADAGAATDSRGLGLAFCQMAVEAHAGAIWIEANEPVGARFCFSLPIRRA